MADRPPIPANIKLAVRKRCGYGCVICGAQPYDYDHIEEYERVQCHEEHNLTLLCKHHHGEKTLKNLTKELIEAANLSPFNLKDETTKSRFLYYSGSSVEVHIGDNIFKYYDLDEGFTFVPLQIDGEDIISFTCEGNKLLLSFKAYDRSNNLVMEIIDNEIQHSTSVWDAEWTANKLTLREGNRRFILRLLFETPNIIKIDKGYFHYNETDLLLDEEVLFVANDHSILGGNTATNCKVGLSVSGHGVYTDSWKDVKAAFKKAKKSLTKQARRTR